MAGKGIFQLREDFRKDRTFTLGYIHPGVGNFGRTIGIVGASKIGRRVLELLRPFDFTVLLADPYVAEAEAAALGATLLPLDELVARADVVSVHAPDLAETEHLINAERLALMRDGTVVVNTARGRLVGCRCFGNILELERRPRRLPANVTARGAELRRGQREKLVNDPRASVKVAMKLRRNQGPGAAFFPEFPDCRSNVFARRT